mmetsp:Transcript_5182/g.9867  ORF Transcript_5182/g.9867 Transcript_5182/m.9867 type:complete len:203 (-) Transcript_5182:336-944(-)
MTWDVAWAACRSPWGGSGTVGARALVSSGKAGSASSGSSSSWMRHLGSIRIRCWAGALPLYLRCGSLYLASSSSWCFCPTQAIASSITNTLRRRSEAHCSTMSLFRTTSKTLAGSPFLSRSLRTSPHDSGNLRASPGSWFSCSILSKASCTWAGTLPLSQLPGAGIFGEPQTLMNTLRPVSSLVLTTNPSAGVMSSPSGCCC